VPAAQCDRSVEPGRRRVPLELLPGRIASLGQAG
jgi:hypothetical protein